MLCLDIHPCIFQPCGVQSIEALGKGFQAENLVHPDCEMAAVPDAVPASPAEVLSQNPNDGPGCLLSFGPGHGGETLYRGEEAVEVIELIGAHNGAMHILLREGESEG